MKPIIFLTAFVAGCASIKQNNRAIGQTTPTSSVKNTPIKSKANPQKPKDAPKTRKKKIGTEKVGSLKRVPEKADQTFLGNLPKWEDIKAPKGMPNPTAGLGVILKTNTCFKEFFGDRTVHPHVRKYGGRILSPGEKAMGRMIICPEERKKKLLSTLKKAGAL